MRARKDVGEVDGVGFCFCSFFPPSFVSLRRKDNEVEVVRGECKPTEESTPQSDTESPNHQMADYPARKPAVTLCLAYHRASILARQRG